MSNMSLEDIIDELSKRGLPNLHPTKGGDYRDNNLKRGIPNKIGTWFCSVQVPHRLDDRNPYRDGDHSGTKAYCDKYMEPHTIQGSGKTARQAADECLERIIFYEEHGWLWGWTDNMRPKDVPKPPWEKGLRKTKV